MKTMVAVVQGLCCFLACRANAATFNEVFSGQRTSVQSSVYGSGTSLVVESKRYDSLAEAKAAIKAKAMEKYKDKYPGSSMSEAQGKAEMAGYIVERKNSDGSTTFYVTGIQELGPEGGARGALQKYRIGDAIYGYHTGAHTTETGLTIPSSMDYKSLLDSHRRHKELADFKMEIVDDLAIGKSAAIDASGTVWSFDGSGKMTKEASSVADYCKLVSGRFQSGYDRTDNYLASGSRNDEDGHAAACVQDATVSVPNGDESLGAVRKNGIASNPAPACQTPNIDMSAMLGQVSGQIANAQSQRHYCTSFEFAKDYRGANREVYAKQYRCTECGKGTMVNVRDGETIEDIIAANRQQQAFADQSYATALSALQGMNDSAPSGGYSSEIMEQFGRVFAEQGPCSAGLQLEAIKNQNRNK